jgi:hypothetical protein
MHLRPWFDKFQREKIIDALVLTLDEAAQLDEAIGLEDLDDVDILTPTAGDTLVYDGTDWVNAAATILDFGTYTPTITATDNASSVAANPAHYIRVGNIVTVTGTATVAATAAGDTLAQATLTLPADTRTINFVNSFDAHGVLSSSGVSTSTEAFTGGEIRAIAGSQVVQIRLRAASTVATSFKYSYTFPITP